MLPAGGASYLQQCLVVALITCPHPVTIGQRRDTGAVPRHGAVTTFGTDDTARPWVLEVEQLQAAVPEAATRARSAACRLRLSIDVSRRSAQTIQLNHLQDTPESRDRAASVGAI